MVKQYEGDAMISALLLLVASLEAGRPTAEASAASCDSGVYRRLAFSPRGDRLCGDQPRAFVFVLATEHARTAKQAVAWNALVMASFVLLYFVSIRHQHTVEMHEVWVSGMADWKHPLTVPGWLGHGLFTFLQSPFRWPGLIFGALIIAAIIRARRVGQMERWMICLMPIVMAIIPALLGQYPFDGSRLNLFLMPELFLLVGAGSMLLWESLPTSLRPAWWLLPLPIFIQGVIGSAHYLIYPRYESHIRPAVEYARQRYRPGDAFALIGTLPMADATGRDKSRFNGRHLEALCYWPDMPEPRYMRFSEWSEIREKRFWLLIAFRPNNPEDHATVRRLVSEIQSVATESDHYFDAHGGAAYLFERSR